MEWLDGKCEKKGVILVAIWKWPGLRMIEHPGVIVPEGGKKRKNHQKQSQI